ncbi:MAG: hypothetical protein HFJ54_01900 [Clostridia bacterium]|nr:hypothetical protein [Clostridia bacterium]
MEEREVDKILNPQKKLYFLFFAFLTISIICIGIVFLFRFDNKDDKYGEPLNLSELRTSGKEKVRNGVKLESNSMPIMIFNSKEEDSNLYYIKDLNDNIYIVRLSNKKFKDIVNTLNQQTGELDSNYEIRGVLVYIDEQTKNLALTNSYKIFRNKELTSDNFSEYLGEFYVKTNFIGERLVVLYNISVLIRSIFPYISIWIYTSWNF